MNVPVPPPLYAFPPDICASLATLRVPVWASPESVAMVRVGDSVAVCLSFAVNTSPRMDLHTESIVVPRTKKIVSYPYDRSTGEV